LQRVLGPRKEITMSLINFIADAGEKLLGSAAAPTPAVAAGAKPDLAALNAAAGAAIEKYIASQNLSAKNLTVKYDGASKTAIVSGIAPDQATKEKILLCCGNVSSVGKVDDQLTVAQAETPPSSFYEVKAGDSLSKIAKSVYGDANTYMKIFEANKPMLSDPNKIYPGQKLRIPASAPP
jgi:nucleoid-associated protein YgaU